MSGRFLNYYACPACDTHWEDRWSSMVDDDCPSCGLRHISPYDSEDIGEEEPA